MRILCLKIAPHYSNRFALMCPSHLLEVPSFWGEPRKKIFSQCTFNIVPKATHMLACRTMHSGQAATRWVRVLVSADIWGPASKMPNHEITGSSRAPVFPRCSDHLVGTRALTSLVQGVEFGAHPFVRIRVGSCTTPAYPPRSR